MIRKLKEIDIPKIRYLLYSAFGKETYSKEQMLSNDSYVMIIKNKICGFCIFEPNYLAYLVIGKKHRGKNYSYKLLKKVIPHIEHPIKVHAWKDNLGKTLLNLGFKRIKNIKKFYTDGTNTVVYRKEK